MKTLIKHLLPDRIFLHYSYWRRMNKKLNLKKPKTFNEKLQWLKLYDRQPIYTTMVDKYAVKQYIADKIGQQYIIPTLGVWDTFDEIDFAMLPNQFVLKCTHDSGGLVICKDKSCLDLKSAKEKITKSLKQNYYWRGREWPYKNVPPRIIAEQYMEDRETQELRDYKFFCFNGEPKMVLVCADRYSVDGLRENFYDTDWNLMPVQRRTHPNTDYKIDKPENLSEMLELVRVLAKDIPFSRIDFYVINKKSYFGEITFYPASGFEAFQPEKWDEIMGSWLTLPNARME